MPVIYMKKKESCLEKEPYCTFIDKFQSLNNEYWDKEIELPIGIDVKKNRFSNGFYIDKDYQNNMLMKFYFFKDNSGGTFIRCELSYEYEKPSNTLLDYHLGVIDTITERAGYYYIPDTECLEFSNTVSNKKTCLYIDAIVANKENVQNVCLSMINQFISIFSMDN